MPKAKDQVSFSSEESTQLNSERSASSPDSYTIGRSQIPSPPDATRYLSNRAESNAINKRPNQEKYNRQRPQKPKKAANARAEHGNLIGHNAIIPGTQELCISSSDVQESIETDHLFQTPTQAAKVEPQNGHEAQAQHASYDSHLRRSTMAPAPTSPMQNARADAGDRRKRPRTSSDATASETQARVHNLEERIRTLEKRVFECRKQPGSYFEDGTPATQAMIRNLQDLIFGFELRREQDREHQGQAIEELRDNFNAKIKELQESVDQKSTTHPAFAPQNLNIEGEVQFRFGRYYNEKSKTFVSCADQDERRG